MKFFRQRFNLSQRDLAAILNCEQSIIAMVESGLRIIPNQIYKKFALIKDYNSNDNDLTLSRTMPSYVKNTELEAKIASYENALINAKRSITEKEEERGEILDLLQFLDFVNTIEEYHSTASFKAFRLKWEIKLDTIILELQELKIKVAGWEASIEEYYKLNPFKNTKTDQ